MPNTQNNFRVALVQMSCSPDPDANLDKAADRVREAARAGANVVCLPELFRTQYFCQREDHALFDLAEPIPGPSTEKLSRIAQRRACRCRRFPVRTARSRHLSQHRRRYRAGWLARRKISQNAYSGRSPLLRKVLFHSRRSWLSQFLPCMRGTLACWSAGISGIRKALASLRSRGRMSFSIPPRLAGTLRRKPNMAMPSTAPGKPSSAPTPLPMESTSVLSIASATSMATFAAIASKVLAWNSGADHFSPILLDASIIQAAHDKEDILIGEIDLHLIEETRRNWPFLRDRRIDAYQPITERFLDE